MAKYTLELGKEFEQQLNQVSEDKDLSKAEVIRRAVATYVVLANEARRGNRITVTDDQNHILKEFVTI